MTEESTKWADKIQKLLRKAESTTPEEAEALLAKAQELMTSYAISEAMIDAARGIERDEVVEERIRYKSSYHKALLSIGQVIAEQNGCRVLMSTMGKYDTLLYVVGFQSDVSRVLLLVSSVQLQAGRALNVWWKTMETGWMTAMEKYKLRREFLFGFSSGLREKLRVANEAGQASAVRDEAARTGTSEGAVSDSMALVLRSRKDRVDDWVDETYGELRSRRGASRSYGGHGASSAGREAGMRADTGTGNLGRARELAR